MVMSLGQLVMDADVIRMYRKMQEGIPVNEITMALDLIRDVGIRGNYIGEAHTVKHYKQQTSPAIFQRGLRSSEAAKTIREIADAKARKILEENSKLAVSEAAAAKIHEMVIEAEEKQMHLKYAQK
jgi:trimethylamine--corrinoid protein Co-methyltransferase